MWTNVFLLTAAENAVTTGLSAFAGSLVITTTPTLKDLAAAGIAGGIAVIYAFAKNLGGVQAIDDANDRNNFVK